jgi:concentrative nucleoside transporter, CNT family
MATIAGGVFAAYVGFLGGSDPVQRQFYATHLLTASILSAPAAIVISKILYPETEHEKINTDLIVSKEKVGSNILDAISNGTTDGLKLAVNVGAMLLAFTAFMYMFNYICKEWIGSWTGLNDLVTAKFSGMYDGFNLQFILGMIFSPLAWILGVSSGDMLLVGQLLGEKTILNEFFAYATLGEFKSSNAFTDPKSIIIGTYALCGFSNFASIGIQIGGIGSLAPNQRQTLSAFGIKALIGGSFACFLTAAIAGMLI